MSVNFKPKTEKQLVEETLIPAAIYPFEVIEAADKTSKAGNPMIELSLRIFLPDGRERVLKSWIMEKMQFQLFHFCAYTGLQTKYDAGTLAAADCVGRSGYAKIVIQADKKGEYPDRNSVADYMRSADGKMPAPGGKPQPTDKQLSNVDDGKGEDVPF